MEKLNVQEREVMRSYLILPINAYIANANFYYKEYSMAKLLQESCKWTHWKQSIICI